MHTNDATTSALRDVLDQGAQANMDVRTGDEEELIHVVDLSPWEELKGRVTRRPIIAFCGEDVTDHRWLSQRPARITCETCDLFDRVHEGDER